jgi:hypothetical protein
MTTRVRLRIVGHVLTNSFGILVALSTLLA